MARASIAALQAPPRVGLVFDAPSRQARLEHLWRVALGNAKAARLMAQMGRRALNAGTAELRAMGLAPSQAARATAVLELGVELASIPTCTGDRICSADDVVAAYSPRLSALTRETFWAVFIDAKNTVVSDELIALGSVASCPVAPTEVFRTAVRVAASALIVVHNHPSGDPTPSREDDVLTAKLGSAAKLLGLKLLDHVIIGSSGRHYSYAAQGALT